MSSCLHASAVHFAKVLSGGQQAQHEELRNFTFCQHPGESQGAHLPQGGGRKVFKAEVVIKMKLYKTRVLQESGNIRVFCLIVD